MRSLSVFGYTELNPSHGAGNSKSIQLCSSPTLSLKVCHQEQHSHSEMMPKKMKARVAVSRIILQGAVHGLCRSPCLPPQALIIRQA